MDHGLVCYCVVGPRELDPRRYGRAVKLAKDVVAMCDRVKEWYDRPENAQDLDQGVTSYVPTAEDRQVFRQTDMWDTGNLEENFQLFAGCNPFRLVREFLKIWPVMVESKLDSTTDDWWDVFVRRDPNKRKQVVVVAGDTTNGESPETEGFQLIHKYLLLGTLTAYGYR